MVLPEAEIDDDDDADLYNDLGGQRNKDSPIDNDCRDISSHINDNDRLDVATHNRLILEMLFKNQAQWKAEPKLKRERVAAEQEGMAAERDKWAADSAEPAERTIAGPGPNIYKMVDPLQYCSIAKELVPFLEAFLSNFNSLGHSFPRGGPDHVKYAISLLDARSNHQNPALRPTAMTDPSEWAVYSYAGSDPCLQDFDLFSQGMTKVYGVKA